MTARWTPVASLVAVTLAPGTIAPCASVTVPWSVAVDCAQSGTASNSVMKAAERNRNVVFGIRNSSLTGRDGRTGSPTGNRDEPPGSGQGWSFCVPTVGKRHAQDPALGACGELESENDNIG